MEVKKRWVFLTLIEEKKAVVHLFRRTHHEGYTDASTKVENAKRYVALLNDLSSEELVKRGIKSRFKEASECQKVMEKEVVRSLALGSLEKMVTGLEQFDAEWTELTLVGLPSCWEPSNSILHLLLAYESQLMEMMNWTDIPSEKSTRLKAETIITVLRK